MNNIIKWLGFCTVLIFFGRAYHYFFWDSPIRVLVWDQELFAPVVEGLLGMNWQDYVADVSVDHKLNQATQLIAALFALAGLATMVLALVRRWWASIPVLLGSLLLLLHALLEMKDHFYHLAQLFEFSIQIGTPILLVWVVLKRPKDKSVLLGIKLLVALTFVAHGLYAIGFYPVPGHFVDMTIRILSVSEATARQLLEAAGFMDLLVGVALFVPATQRAALGYAAVWGLLTALARVVSGFDAYFLWESLHASAYGTVYRLPHGLLPLTALLLLRQMSNTKANEIDPG